MLITRYLVITAIALGFVWSPLVAQETETPKSGGTFDENGNFLKADDVELLDFEVDEGTAVVGEVEATELETEFETEVPFYKSWPYHLKHPRMDRESKSQERRIAGI